MLFGVAAACAAAGTPAGASCGEESESCGGDAQPVVSLSAVVSAHHGSSYAHPGYSLLELVSTPEAAYMTASEPKTRTHLRWLTEEQEANVVRVPWECKHPHRAFRYTLTARGKIGATVTATAVFHAQLSTRWCAAAKAKEEAKRAAERRRHEVEAREKERRDRERREAAEHEASERETSTCTNGTYVNSSGNTVCKPVESESGPPAGATAECEDGTFSFSEHHSGTCSSHGGVRRWL